MKYSKHFSTKKTTQSQKLPGSKQIQNSDGCYVYGVDDWKRLDRFLILGSEGGSYYATERALTVENAEAVVRCVKGDGARAVKQIVEVSHAGRAAKNDPAIFALAIAAKLGDEATRREAYAAMPIVCRIPTHLFAFVEFCEGFGGWGRGMRNAVSNWYTGRKSGQLAYHLAKYQQRNGWSNRDLLRLAHAKPQSPVQNALFRWVVKGELGDTITGGTPEDLKALQLIEGFERAKRTESPAEAATLVREFRLTREMLPTRVLTDARVWEALFEKMPMTAMLRNLGNMSKCDLLKPFSDIAKEVVSRLTNKEVLAKARIHPLQVLTALNTYRRGQGVKGKGSWTPVSKVNDALEEAFYLSFENIEPTGKRHLLCIDTSGSMASGAYSGGFFGIYGGDYRGIQSLGGMTPREAAAAMSMVTARVESESLFISYSVTASELPFTAKWTLQEVLDRTNKFPAYSTDCAAPIVHALKRDYDVDTIVLYTDSETNATGSLQPVVALRKLRDKLGHDVKFIVVGMVSNGFTVADPDDGSMLDVVGFDTSAPRVMAEFTAGNI